MTRGVRAVATGLCGVALAVLGGLTLLAAAGRLGWPAELATHFRLQYVLALALLVPALLGLGRRAQALLAAALLALNGAYVAPYLPPRAGAARPASAPAGATRIVALNLYYRNEDFTLARAYLERVAPDVLVLSELTPQAVQALRAVTDAYPHRISVDRRSPWGLGVYSRHRLRGARWTNLGVRGGFNVHATVEAPGGAFELVAVHLASPTTARNAALRDAQLRELARLLGPPGPAAGRPPRVAVGDFNITPFAPAFGDLLAATGLQDARRSRGLLGTWPAPWRPLLIPIDHCVADVAAGVVGVARGPYVGSDHYPLEVTLAVAREGGAGVGNGTEPW